MLNITLTVDNETYDFTNDFECLPMSYSIGKAEPKLNLVDVPYADGTVDMTNALTSDVKYRDRTIMIPMKLVGDAPKDTYSRISNLFAGKRCQLVIDDEDWYYQGRVQIDSLGTSGMQWLFQFIMIAEPYKYKDHYCRIEPPLEPASLPRQFYFHASRKRTIPLIISDGEFITYGKNLLPYPYFIPSNFDYNEGIYLTDLGDGTIILNGKTSENAAQFYLNYFSTPSGYEMPDLYAGEQYTLSGGITNLVNIYLATSERNIAVDIGQGKEFVYPTLAPGEYLRVVWIRIPPNVTLENVIVKPMIRRSEMIDADTMAAYTGDDLASWEPYRKVQIPSGQSKIPRMIIGDGKNIINIPVERTCAISYKEGSL